MTDKEEKEMSGRGFSEEDRKRLVEAIKWAHEVLTIPYAGDPFPVAVAHLRDVQDLIRPDHETAPFSEEDRTRVEGLIDYLERHGNQDHPEVARDTASLRALLSAYDQQEARVAELEQVVQQESQMKAIFAQEAQGLEQALAGAWLSNHDERCDNLHGCESFGGESECYHPRPAALHPDAEPAPEGDTNANPR